ncbi:TPA: PKD domain-containing protein, partial [Candidatus Poribacteria bacterium]|nr:PKD domain-containing protein [Candidatus Poribacteria bacterium]
MMFKRFITFNMLWILILILSSQAWSIPIFSVGGKVEIDEQPAAAGTIVIVENETRKLTMQTVVGGGAGEGRYAVAFVDTGGKTVAEVDDKLKVTVKDKEGKKTLFSIEYQITEADIAAGRAIVDFPPPPPDGTTISVKVNSDTLAVDGKKILTSVITATVKDAEGNPVTDEEVEMEASPSGIGELSKVKNNNDGTYTATYTAPISVSAATIPLTIKATAKNTNVSDSIEITLKDAEEPVAKADLDQIVSVGETVSLDGSKSTDNVGIAKYSWDFDDKDGIQEDAAGAKVETSYAKAGTYTVTLTVTDTSGNKGEDKGSFTVVEINIKLVDLPSDFFEAGSTYTITAKVTDTDGNPVTIEEVKIEVTKGEIGDVAPINGTYTATYTAPKKIEVGEKVTITATATKAGVSDSKEIPLHSGPANTVSAMAEPDSLDIDGKSALTSKVTATVKDVNGNMVTDEDVAIVLEPNIGQISEVNNNHDGTYTAIYTSPISVSAETVVVTVKATATKANVSGSGKINLINAIPPSGSISGMVTLPDEKTPVPNATVKATGPVEKSATTGEDGKYKINNLKAGSYNVDVSKPGYTSDSQKGVQVESDKETSSIDFQIEPYVVIDSPAPIQKVKVGATAGYIITVKWINGFDSPVTLEARELPKGVEKAEFSPQVVKPIVAERTPHSQLTIKTSDRILEGIPEDEYDFKFVVRGSSEGLYWETPFNLLTLQMEKWDSYITVSADPQEVQYDDKSIKISGDITLTGYDDKDRVNLPVILTFAPPEGDTIQESTNAGETDRHYGYQFNPVEWIQKGKVKPEQMIGKWQVQAEWSGDDKYKAARSAEAKSFEVKKGTSRITWWDETIKKFVDNSITIVANLGDSIQLTGSLDKPSLSGQDIEITITKPDEPASQETVSTDDSGQFKFPPQDKLMLNQEGIWEIEAHWPENVLYNGTTSKIFKAQVAKGLGLAIIIQGSHLNGGIDKNFDGNANYAYEKLRDCLTLGENVYYLRPSLKKAGYMSADIIINKVTSLEAMELAITSWAAGKEDPNIKATPYTPLYIYMVGHNSSDEREGARFMLNSKETLTPRILNDWLGQLSKETGVSDITIVIEASHSGAWIKPLAAEGRTIITSQDAEKTVRVDYSISFSINFFAGINDYYGNIKEAFVSAKDGIEQIYPDQNPQLEADDELNEHNSDSDYIAVKDKYIGKGFTCAETTPELIAISPPQKLLEGQPAENLWVEVGARRPAVKVWGLIYPPCKLPDPLPTISFFESDDVDGIGKWEWTADNFFSEEGLYTIAVFAEDADGNVSMPIITHIDTTPWDINHDKVVDISDLVSVARQFGESPPEKADTEKTDPDANGDGVVDISDLVLVGKHFGEEYCVEEKAAPQIVSSPKAKIWLQVKPNHDGNGFAQAEVLIDSPVDVYGFQFDLSFHPDEIEVMSVSEGGYLGGVLEGTF